MSDERTGPDADGRRPYNRPRRYAPATPATTPVAPEPAEVTRQNPTLAEAAQDYERRYAGPPAAPGQEPYPYPGAAEQTPPYAPAPAPAGASRTQSKRVLLIGVAVLVLIAVVGLVVGLSNRDDSTPAGARSAGPAPAATPSVASISVPSTSVASTSVPSTSDAPPGGSVSASEICTRLGNTSPLTSFVAEPHPAERMPDSYVEPQAGTKVGVCVGRFRPGAGPGRGRFAFLAQYEQLPAPQYALRLKTLGWELVPTLPNPTYRNPLNTTVTLVQQGTALVTVVGTGR